MTLQLNLTSLLCWFFLLISCFLTLALKRIEYQNNSNQHLKQVWSSTRVKSNFEFPHTYRTLAKTTSNQIVIKIEPPILISGKEAHKPIMNAQRSPVVTIISMTSEVSSLLRPKVCS